MGAAGAASPVVGWISRLGTGADAVASAIDSSNNVYVVGSNTAGVAGSGLEIAKYNTDGALQWQRMLDGALTDRGESIAVDSGGNVYIAGYFNTIGDPYRGLLAKYNSSGTLLWQRQWQQNTDYANYWYGVAVDSSANVYVVGEYDQGAGSRMAIAKYNTSGTLQWANTLGGPGGSNGTYGKGISVDSSANVYVVGSYYGPAPNYFEIVIAKLNTSGDLQWQRMLGGSPTRDDGYSIAVDSGGNAYIAGQSNSKALTAKYNTSGDLQWQRTLSGGVGESANGIALDSSANVYTFGTTYNSTATRDEALIAKYDSSGSLQWQRRLGGGRVYLGKSAVSGDGNFYAGGLVVLPVDLYYMLTVKLPVNGDKLGTFGSFVYSATTLTDAAGTLTSSIPTGNFNSAGGTSSTTTLTSSTSTLTNTLTLV